jgi:hypothetical protein
LLRLGIVSYKFNFLAIYYAGTAQVPTFALEIHRAAPSSTKVHFGVASLIRIQYAGLGACVWFAAARISYLLENNRGTCSNVTSTSLPSQLLQKKWASENEFIVHVGRVVNKAIAERV